MDYMQSQLIKAQAVTPSGTPGNLKIQIQGETGKTNWLNISPETLRKIEQALIEQAETDAMALGRELLAMHGKQD